MRLPREVMLSLSLVKNRELWGEEKDSGSFDWISVFTQLVFVTQVQQPLTLLGAEDIISSD